jgi:hypothetical protein
MERELTAQSITNPVRQARLADVGRQLSTHLYADHPLPTPGFCDVAPFEAAPPGLLSHPGFGAPRPGHEHNHQVCWDQVSHI